MSTFSKFTILPELVHLFITNGNSTKYFLYKRHKQKMKVVILSLIFYFWHSISKTKTKQNSLTEPNKTVSIYLDNNYHFLLNLKIY